MQMIQIDYFKLLVLGRLFMDKIKESDLKIYINKDKIYYEYEGVNKLLNAYNELRKKVKNG